MKQLLTLMVLRNKRWGAPLHQLEPIDVDEATCQVFEDWHYWLARGY
jgi:hypothetical protein